MICVPSLPLSPSLPCACCPAIIIYWFALLVELMDPSEVVNGEELEECTFKARGKLFRLSSKEWVEKGIGNLKVSESGGGSGRGGKESASLLACLPNSRLTARVVFFPVAPSRC